MAMATNKIAGIGLVQIDIEGAPNRRMIDVWCGNHARKL